MKTVVEYCSECDTENEFRWDVETDGYKAYCPHCGKVLMLCDECVHSDDTPAKCNVADSIGECVRAIEEVEKKWEKASKNIKLIIIIPLRDADIKRLKMESSLVKQNFWLQRHACIKIGERPNDAPKDTVYLTDDDVELIKKEQILVKSVDGANAEFQIMKDSVYDKIPKEIHDKKWYENEVYLNEKELKVVYDITIIGGKV